MTAATFTKVYDEVIAGAGCAVTLCHADEGTSKLPMVDMDETYMKLVNVMGMGTEPGAAGKTCASAGVMRVKPNDPTNSLLVQKLEGTHTCGDAMPPGGMLKPDQLALLRAWIMNGALKD